MVWEIVQVTFTTVTGNNLVGGRVCGLIQTKWINLSKQDIVLSVIHFKELLHDGATVSLCCAVDEVIHGTRKISTEWKVANLLGFGRIVNLFVAAIVTLPGVGSH